MKDNSRRHPWRVAAGVALIVLGVIGCFLPLLQGMALIALGLGLLGIAPRRLRRRVDKKAREPGHGSDGETGRD